MLRVSIYQTDPNMKQIIHRMSLAAGVFLVAASFTSCASLFDGKTQQVTFTSPQPKSSVMVEGQKYTLPVSATISKKTTSATFSNAKYASKELTWKRDYQWGYLFMDVLFTPGWGISGLIWDGSTQAWYKHPAVIDYDFAAGKTNVTEVVSPSVPATPAPVVKTR